MVEYSLCKGLRQTTCGIEQLYPPRRGRADMVQGKAYKRLHIILELKICSLLENSFVRGYP